MLSALSAFVLVGYYGESEVGVKDWVFDLDATAIKFRGIPLEFVENVIHHFCVAWNFGEWAHLGDWSELFDLFVHSEAACALECFGEDGAAWVDGSGMEFGRDGSEGGTVDEEFEDGKFSGFCDLKTKTLSCGVFGGEASFTSDAESHGDVAFSTQFVGGRAEEGPSCRGGDADERGDGLGAEVREKRRSVGGHGLSFEGDDASRGEDVSAVLHMKTRENGH